MVTINVDISCESKKLGRPEAVVKRHSTVMASASSMLTVLLKALRLQFRPDHLGLEVGKIAH